MPTHLPAAAGAWRFARLMCIAAAMTLTGCAAFYVDGQVKDVPAAEFKKPASPRPVQMVFEFQSKGVPNASVTTALKAQVTEVVASTGLFSTISETPVDGGRLVNVVVNNVPVTDGAFAKGFATGLTFGLAGTSVTDGYVCTITYLDGNREPIKLSTRHAIHTALGTGEPPPGAIEAESLDAAVRTMTRQILENAFHALSHESSFQ